MVASSVSVWFPIDAMQLPETIVRPAIIVNWTGGVGQRGDVYFTWDDDPLFGNANGLRQQVTQLNVNRWAMAAPPADLGDTTPGKVWYVKGEVEDIYNEKWTITHDHTSGLFTLTWNGSTTLNIAWNASAATIAARLEADTGLVDVTVTGSTGNWVVEVIDPGGQDIVNLTATNVSLAGGTHLTVTETQVGGVRSGGLLADSNNEFTYFSTTFQNRHLYLLANVGPGFAPTDEPGIGWGEGVGGTVGPDGDVIDFNRHLYLFGNVGPGFEPFDRPAGGWGPEGNPDGGDGKNISFHRHLYQLANVDDTQPTPFIFRIEPTVGKDGDGVTVYGQGFTNAIFSETEVLASTHTSSNWSGQTCNVTPNRQVFLESIRWRPASAGNYELRIDGVSYGTKALAASEYGTWILPDVSKSAQFEVKFVFVDGNESVYYNTNDAPIDTGVFTFGEWQEAAPGETVPMEITFSAPSEYGEEVRMYQGVGTAGTFIVMPTVSLQSGEWEDIFQVTIPAGGEIGTFEYVTVVHTTEV